MIGTIPVGEDPVGLAVSPNGQDLYVANEASDTVLEFNTATDALVTSVNVAGSPVGVAVNPTNGYGVVYVTDMSGNTVSVLARL